MLQFLLKSSGFCVGTILMFSLCWFHRSLVATDPVFVSFPIGRHEGVALLLFINCVGFCCDNVSVEDLIACIRLCWFHRTLVAIDPVLVPFAIRRHAYVALLL